MNRTIGGTDRIRLPCKACAQGCGSSTGRAEAPHNVAGLGVVGQEVQHPPALLHVLLGRRLEAVHQVCGQGTPSITRPRLLPH